MSELTLRKDTPRQYPVIEAFRGRVWRSRAALIGKDVMLFSGLVALYGLLLDHGLSIEIGLLGLFLACCWVGFSTLWVNLARVRLVRHGRWGKGVIIQRKRLLLWHELLRAEKHRSFLIRYRYQVNQREYVGQLTLCRCAFDRLSVDQAITIAYHENSSSKSLPLRVAVMTIPH